MEPTRRRGPLQHVFDILKNTRKPIKKTHLYYAAKINEKGIHKYMPSLVDKGLIEEVPYIQRTGKGKGRRIDGRTTHRYVITDKGEALLRLYERIYDILGWGGGSDGS